MRNFHSQTWTLLYVAAWAADLYKRTSNGGADMLSSVLVRTFCSDTSLCSGVTADFYNRSANDYVASNETEKRSTKLLIIWYYNFELLQACDNGFRL